MPITTPALRISDFAGDADHFRYVMDHLFKPAIEKIGYEPISPVSSGADVIHAEIIRNLETCDLVLCDMSELNPNVFFELGIRTAVDRPVALVKDRLTSHVPFDTTLVNHHTYDSSLAPWSLDNEVQRLAEHLQGTLNGSGGRNTLWRYFGLTSRAELPAPSSVDEKLDAIVKLLQQSSVIPIPSAIPADAALAREKEFINKAQAVAEEVKAKLTVDQISAGAVDFDLGDFLLDPRRRDRIVRLDAGEGIKVTIRGGGDLRHVRGVPKA